MAVPLRLLLLEDNDDDALLVLRELKRAGYEPLSHRVQSASQLVEALQKQDWDVVISDFAMPQFSGIDAVRIVKQAKPQLPFILVSGTIGEETAVLAMKAGASDYLMKSSLKRLASAVQREIKDTQTRRAEAEQRHAKEQAQSANRAKSDFLANMSHEIRTPLAAIIGYADRMLEPGLEPSDRLDCVNTIRRNGEHLLTLINDILDISKIEAGEMVTETIQCSPCQIVCEVASIMRVKAGQKQLKLEIIIDGAIPQTIDSDPFRLRQVLINLIGNAIKFTEIGWVRLIVKLIDSPDSPNPRLSFEVIDSGIGMSTQQIARLFKPFSQADTTTTRRFGGTGLGLSISKKLAVMLGGDLSADSSLGRGSRFVLIVPTGPLKGTTLVNRCTESMADAEAAPQPDNWQLTGRILIVDDGPENRDLLSYYLRQAGADVSLAENGLLGVQRALEALAAGKPFDLIFMDMQMPELDGYAAAAKLRLKGFSGPIVALTAHAMATDREKCLASGCSDYLSKPARKPQLLDHGDLAHLREMAHRLKGSGGLFGFTQITDLAGTLDSHLSQENPLPNVSTSVKELIELLRRVEGYQRAAESTLAKKS